ncbi:MliC family protein [Psychromonas sp. CNPT3]|uniref:MliC family protein n=1 Tax=Psychromonas sp. CNPT3 TaxID=314282 RepID=UPI0003226F2E|nr:MliC family protein [Psychromonas sp. CNPT3]
MKIYKFLTLASIFLVSACVSTPKDDADIKQSATPPALALTISHYRCESGASIMASYPSFDSANIQYKGRRYHLEIAVSASGARYVGGNLEWWTKGSAHGSEASLFEHVEDGTSGDRLEFCTEL